MLTPMRPAPVAATSQVAGPGSRVAPLVGRDAELAALLTVIQRAPAREPGPRLAVLRGDPGVGKSRLLQAMSEQAAAGHRLLAWRADELTSRMPYALLTDALGAAVQPWTDRDPVGPDVQPGGHPPGQAVGSGARLVAGAVPAAVADRVAGILRAWARPARPSSGTCSRSASR